MAYNKHIFSCPWSAGCWQFHWWKLGWAGSREAPGFLLHSGLLHLSSFWDWVSWNSYCWMFFLCVGCKSMRINVETQDASLGFCWQFAHRYFSPHSIDWSMPFHPSQNQQSRKVDLPIRKGTVKLHDKEGGCIIPIHRGRDPISVGISNLKLSVFLT